MGVARRLRGKLPGRVARIVRAIVDHPVIARLRGWIYRGDSRYCTVCGGSFSRFLTFGSPARADARCPRCGALERHRFLWRFLKAQPELFRGGERMLHFAPEIALERRFRSMVGAGYVSADLEKTRAMVAIDVTAIPYPDASFDIIYCSHVLEHVTDDRLAMRELRRVLASGGWAILNVPIRGETTYEDPAITTPEGREKAYGQWDHVRYYGRDYVDRLRASGFDVQIVTTSDLVTDEERTRLGLTPAAGEIFFCRPA